MLLCHSCTAPQALELHGLAGYCGFYPGTAARHRCKGTGQGAQAGQGSQDKGASGKETGEQSAAGAPEDTRAWGLRVGARNQQH